MLWTHPMALTDEMLSRHCCKREDAWMEAHETPFQKVVCEICVDVKMRDYRKFMLKNKGNTDENTDSN